MTAAIEQDTLIATKSVTEGDIPKSVYSVTFMPYNWWGWNTLGGPTGALLPNLLPNNLPYHYTRESDYVLYESGKFEGRWASAVKIAGSKVAARAFELKSDKPQLLKRYSELLHNFEDKKKSPVWFFLKVTRDYTCCDNGAFIEIDRQTGAAGSRIKGLYVLDSRRCRRTGVPETPVMYTDLEGQIHLLKDYQVIDIVDQPDTSAYMFGTGESAARRAYRSIRLLNAFDQFRYEKVIGRPLALDFITGITDDQVQQVIRDQQTQRAAQGVSVYGGSILVPLIKPNGIDHVHVPLAELPENFDIEKERRLALYDYANAIGIDSQELIPLTGAALGTATQSQMLDDKQEGKGLATLMLEITHALEQWVLPDTVTFTFSEKTDYRDQKAKADVFATIMGALVQAVGKDGTVLDHNQALNYLIDEDLMDKKYLPPAQDLTPEQSISDTERVEDLPEQAFAPQPQPTQPPAPAPQPQQQG